MPKTAGSGESHGASTAVWRWPGPPRASQTRRWRSKFIHGRDSLAGEGAVSQLGTALWIPAATFAQILAFWKLFSLLAAGRRGKEDLESSTACGAIPSCVNDAPHPRPSHSTDRKRGRQQEFPIPIPFPSLQPGFRRASRFSASHPTDISEPTRVISSGSLGEEREVLARGG